MPQLQPLFYSYLQVHRRNQPTKPPKLLVDPAPIVAKVESSGASLCIILEIQAMVTDFIEVTMYYHESRG